MKDITVRFGSTQEILMFSKKLQERSEDLQDQAWTETHESKTSVYKDASSLDDLFQKTDEDSQSK